MSDVRVRAEHLSKMFLVGGADGEPTTASTLLRHYGPLLAGRKPADDGHQLWALKDVSFEVRAGEVIGIVGRNGSGKSTLLKILSRVTAPSAGSFSIDGRVGSLLEVGTGFHPDLTGRQNVFLNGSILGMSQAEIAGRFDEIVAFAEVDRFIDTPVRHYSSGMYMRLAFAVSAHLDCDILLVDEVLAVGDIKFQRKCLALMRESMNSGKTVFFVSHSSAIILQVCNRALWLDSGRVFADDTPHNVVERYISQDMTSVGERTWTPEAAPRFPDGSVGLRAVRLRDAGGAIVSLFEVKQPIVVEFEFDVDESIHPINVHVYVAHDTSGKLFVSMDNLDTPWNDKPAPAGHHTARCTIPADFLNEGTFTLEAVICTHPTTPDSLAVPDVLIFRVYDDMTQSGVRGNWEREWPPGAVRPRLRWTHEQTPPTV
jgi:lipopolysaccharide transport system ATP-binding protein